MSELELKFLHRATLQFRYYNIQCAAVLQCSHDMTSQTGDDGEGGECQTAGPTLPPSARTWLQFLSFPLPGPT